jgi:hypothetical protein
LRLNLNGFIGGAGADFIKVKWNVLRDHLRRHDWTHRRWRRFLVPKGEGTKEKDDEQ